LFCRNRSASVGVDKTKGIPTLPQTACVLR
jgi:hypothetical protein